MGIGIGALGSKDVRFMTQHVPGRGGMSRRILLVQRANAARQGDWTAELAGEEATLAQPRWSDAVICEPANRVSLTRNGPDSRQSVGVVMSSNSSVHAPRPAVTGSSLLSVVT